MKKLVVLTGAGISAESGLSTFRDADGLWNNYPVMDVASHDGFVRNPALIHSFYNSLRRQLLDKKPNAAHLGLKELEKDFDVRIITQNVDDLHERAGSSHVLHLHGELMKVRSMTHEERVDIGRHARRVWRPCEAAHRVLPGGCAQLRPGCENCPGGRHLCGYRHIAQRLSCRRTALLRAKERANLLYRPSPGCNSRGRGQRHGDSRTGDCRRQRTNQKT